MEQKIIENMEDMNTELMNVRRAFRMLNNYQLHIFSIVKYIKNLSVFKDKNLLAWKLYSRPVRTKDLNPKSRRKSRGELRSPLNVDDIWAWDFLYGYMMEYSFGTKMSEDKIIEMSVIQVSDDGAVNVSNRNSFKFTDEFKDVENSHSYLVFCCAVTKKDAKQSIWFGKGDVTWEGYHNCIWEFLKGNDFKVVEDENDKENVFVMKRYDMACLFNQDSMDEVIKDFNDLIVGCTGETIFEQK